MTAPEENWARVLLRRVGPTSVDATFQTLADVLDPACGGDEGLYRDLCESYEYYRDGRNYGPHATADYEGLSRELRDAYRVYYQGTRPSPPSPGPPAGIAADSPTGSQTPPETNPNPYERHLMTDKHLTGEEQRIMTDPRPTTEREPMTNFSFPADGPDARLLEHLMLGEENSFEANGKVKTLLCEQAEPTDMTPDDVMSEKKYRVMAVEPSDNVEYAIQPTPDDHIEFVKEREVMRVTRTYPDGSKRIAIFPMCALKHE